MALPRKLKNFDVFNEGISHIGVASEIILPKLTRATEEWRGGGMSGTVDIDHGMQKLTVEHTYGGFMRQIFQQWGIHSASGVLLRFAGAYQRDDTGEVDAVEVVMRGRHTEIDGGTSKAGDDTVFKVTSSLTYYKLIVNGGIDVEIDVLNMIELIDGVDRLAEQRAAIGL